ncbi:hypothetical protein P154DRAFT_556379 [Amniculicola lignicola CBS 123094]|uniref:Spherulation-specific family 4 n=1 Tax=Amniculicola lignicola CBS 123094 TaxID=1392246 RepID=A0A6A5W389_9PLEO|nr:hypothetical protein P154DRAFT_556379 [Amniculicola lignicola CBS 123094]
MVVQSRSAAMSILLPLYIYPKLGYWQPLYDAATAYPDVDFTVVVNPCSGPCMGSLPDQAYLDEIPKLGTYGNIRRLGYVATTYATKEIDKVLAEIDTYAKWPALANQTQFRVDGIFFDEAPSLYDEKKYEYMKAAGQRVRSGTGFQQKYVVHNPGTAVSSLTTGSPSYLNLTDVTVVLESSYDDWLQRYSTIPAGISTSKLAVILHSVPTVDQTKLNDIVDSVEEVADWVYMTDLAVKDEYYHSWGNIFGSIVQAVNAR